MSKKNIEDRVRWLCDRERILELPQLYAYGVDTDDWSLVASVFSPDCYVTGTVTQAPIDEYLELLEPGVKRYSATMHLMGNQLVRVEGDAGHVETYAVAYHMEPEESEAEDLITAVRYQDDVARVGDGDDWKITRRNVINQWKRGPLPSLEGNR